MMMLFDGGFAFILISSVLRLVNFSWFRLIMLTLLSLGEENLVESRDDSV